MSNINDRKGITKENIEGLMETVCNLYLADDIPWVIGYSGGKDSTATLQLVWLSLLRLPKEKRKIVHADLEQAKQDMRNQGIDIDGKLEKFCEEFNKKHQLGKYSKEESIDEKTERCKKMFNKANDILYSEYNHFVKNFQSFLSNKVFI